MRPVFIYCACGAKNVTDPVYLVCTYDVKAIINMSATQVNWDGVQGLILKESNNFLDFNRNNGIYCLLTSLKSMYKSFIYWVCVNKLCALFNQLIHQISAESA